MSHLFSLDHLTDLDSFGHALRGVAYRFRPVRPAEIADLFVRAQRAGLSVALRGAGRSYGDAALNAGQVVLDLQRLNRILEWDPDTGLICVEPGVTFQQLWQYTLEDGWWPPVVPGTMSPTLGGALAMNIHGKNNWHAGTLGEHVRSFTALLPTGASVTCAPDQNPDLFYSLIGGAGLLGVFTSITLQLKRLYSGDVRVRAWATPDLRTMLNDLDWFKADHDYIVGWVDGAHPAGRGQIHAADYLAAGEDPHPARTLALDYQTLPDTFFGVLPKSMLWRFMQFLMNNPGVALTNAAKYLLSATLENRAQYRQSLAAFNFLLDYVPNWERAYGAGGLIQHQTFLPLATAADAYSEMLRLAQRRGLPPYLGVTKRHRPDKFLLTHAVDGYSFALDFKVTGGRGRAGNRPALQALADELNAIALAAGGRFYFAKDSTLTPDVAARYLGEATLRRFQALKQRCDPAEVLQSNLYRRILRPAWERAAAGETRADETRTGETRHVASHPASHPASQQRPSEQV